MNTSPYDNLPVGSQKSAGNADLTQEAADTLEYVEIPFDDEHSNHTDAAMGEDTSHQIFAEQQTSQSAEKQNHEESPVQTAAVEPAPVQTAQQPFLKQEDSQEGSQEPPENQAQPQSPSQTVPTPHRGSARTFAQEHPQNSAQAFTQNPDSEDSRIIESFSANQALQVDNSSYTKLSPMDNSPVYEKLFIKNRFNTGQYILPFEETLLVPDTMPDIEKILFAEGNVNPAQPGKTSYKKGDSISGDITLFTVYRPDKKSGSPVDVIKSTVAFKTDKCWENSPAGSFKASVSVKSLSSEMVNERKFTAKGELLIEFTEIAPKELLVFKDSRDKDLIFLRKTIRAADLIFETEDQTEISQEINIKDDCPSPVKILKEIIHIVENHKQITAGKLIINATIHSDILYEGILDGENKLFGITNKTEFTQFTVLKENCDAELVKASFISDGLKIKISGENEFLLEGQVRTIVRGYENKDIHMVSDAYHKQRDIKFDISRQFLTAVKGTVSGEISSREIVNIEDSSKTPDELLCGNVIITDISARPEKSRIIIEGSLKAKLLALDEDKEPFLIESSIPLRGSLEMPEQETADCESLSTEITAEVKDFWFDEINSRQLEINVSIAISVWVSMQEFFDTLENFAFAEQDNPPKRISMALYTVGRGDTLWDIAKRYKSNAASLSELNQIDETKPLPEGMKLLISK